MSSNKMKKISKTFLEDRPPLQSQNIRDHESSTKFVLVRPYPRIVLRLIPRHDRPNFNIYFKVRHLKSYFRCIRLACPITGICTYLVCRESLYVLIHFEDTY